MKLVVMYGLFALLSIVVNIASQEISLAIYSAQFAILVSVIVGTGTGLVTKFILDKLFIFRHRSNNLGEDFGKFVSYSMTGVVTTLIFWGFEFGFQFLFGTKIARYTGAVIGLSIGYILKYQLDKKYVFNKDPAPC